MVVGGGVVWLVVGFGVGLWRQNGTVVPVGALIAELTVLVVVTAVVCVGVGVSFLVATGAVVFVGTEFTRLLSIFINPHTFETSIAKSLSPN